MTRVFARFVSCMLFLSTIFVVVEPLPNRRGNSLCGGHANLDENSFRSDIQYHRVLVDSNVGDEENYVYVRESPDDIPDTYDEENDDRSSALEWKKVQRYVKRQLKVPRRYLRKIIRKLYVASKIRSFDNAGREVIIASPSGDSSGFDTSRLLVLDTPESQEYYAIIATNKY